MAAELIGTRRISDDPLAMAILDLIAVLKSDFGTHWSAQFKCDEDLRHWKRRAYAKLRGIPIDCIVDGYETAMREHAPYMPVLAEIVAIVKRIHGERIRTAEQIAIAEAPRVNGLAGYVEHLNRNNRGEWAQRHVALMREILARPAPATDAERKARIEQSVRDHDELMKRAPPVRHRGQGHVCAVSGCMKPGNLTHSLGAENATWFCREHWRKA